ncbi:MAG: hypothetical protein KKH98_03245 [Spirochaetes bacterium]|nr:hypothetical protein [Spirochaetota bacterium]
MEISKLKEIYKKLEGVYKITGDAKQKERVKKEMNDIKSQVADMEKYGKEEVLKEDEEQEEVVVKEVEKKESNKKENKLLSRFPVKKVHPASNDNEVNTAITYLEIFEGELWGALSDFHLKLDYYHSKERDKYFNKFEVIKRLIKQYFDVLDELSSATNETYIEKLKLMKNKQSRALLIDSVKFMNEIGLFLDKLVKDFNNKGNTILNPEDKITFSNIEGKRLLNGWKIIDAIKYIKQYSREYIGAINLPEEILKLND